VGRAAYGFDGTAGFDETNMGCTGVGSIGDAVPAM